MDYKYFDLRPLDLKMSLIQTQIIFKRDKNINDRKVVR